MCVYIGPTHPEEDGSSHQTVRKKLENCW